MSLPVEVGTDDVQAHPRHTGHHRFDLVMAICAIFISAVSLVVAIDHGRTERQLVSANAWPFLRQEVSNEYGVGRAIEIGVSNGGVGPAKIRSFTMSLDGQPIASPGDLLRRCCGVPAGKDMLRVLRGGWTTSEIDDSVLRPGETNPVLVIPRRTTDPAVFGRLNAALYRLRFQACYCSILDECWTSTLRSTETVPVKTCAPPAHPYRYGAS